MKSRNYNNIVVLDNKSTYQPLLNWYKEEDINVFYCKDNYGPGALDVCRRSEHQFKEKYLSIIEQEYHVYTDSDVVPVDEVPDNFIDDMVDMAKTYQIPKLGLSLKIDDIPDYFALKNEVINHEGGFFTQGYIEDPRCKIFKAAVDTTFAVNSPGLDCGLHHGAYRTGDNYAARHMPWYYDTNNLPEDERYYYDNLTRISHWSALIKNRIK